MKVRNNGSRKFKGSVLAMSCVLTGLLMFALMACLSLVSLFATQYRLQKCAETLALTRAASQNEENKIGIINKMMVRSRNMIWQAAESKRKARDNFPQLLNLAEQVLDESKNSRDGMYSSKTQVANNMNVDDDSWQSLVQEMKGSFKMDLPWLSISILDNPSYQVGSLKESGSNVRLEMAEEEIEQNDLDHNLVYPNSKLFKGNIDAVLQDEESGTKSFHLSALPADFAGISSQAHLISADQFDPMAAPQYLRAACQVTLSVDIICPLIGQKQKLVARGFAVSGGGLPDEE